MVVLNLDFSLTTGKCCSFGVPIMITHAQIYTSISNCNRKSYKTTLLTSLVHSLTLQIKKRIYK